MKLQPKNDVLATFLSIQDLPKADKVLIKPLGSDGHSLYLHGHAIVALADIQSVQIDTVASRLMPREEPSTRQALLLLVLIVSAGFVGNWLKPHLHAYNWLLLCVVLLWLIYALADYVFKWRRLPREHYRLSVHTRFGEQIVLIKAQNRHSLNLVQIWIEQQTKHAITLQANPVDI